MEAAKTCQDCGQPIGPKAVHGLCLKCLLKLGLGTAGQTAPAVGAPPQARRPSFRAPEPAELAGSFPRLDVLELVGQGGMGAVYKARQKGLDRFVALKILAPETISDPAFSERFMREAQALAKLNHPNIVAVYDFGQAGGFYYFIMEYVDGANLRQLEQTGRLGPREAMQIVPQICDALQYAHDEGVVHRDIKPENMLVDRKGRVKIADFGLAKILGREPSTLRLTDAGQVMGTPHYMAPEQVERPLAVDHRADIYSLGVVFYEMLTGELPLGKFPPPSRKVQVDVRLDEVVLRALEKEPERRYQQASQVKSDVETIAASSPRISAPVGNAPGRRNPAVGGKSLPASSAWVWWLSAAVVVSVVVLAAVVFYRGHPDLMITGIVTDAATGQPIAGARVADNRDGPRAAQSPQEARTDQTGRYRLRTWQEAHSLTVSNGGYGSKLATLAIKSLGRERELRLDFQLPPLGVSGAAKESGVLNDKPFLVTGQAMDEKGKPIPGARIWAACGEGTLSVASATETDAAGWFRLNFGFPEEMTGSGVAVAKILVRKAGFFEASLGRDGLLAVPRQPLFAAESHRYSGVLKSNQIYVLDLVLRPAAAIAGVLVNESGAALPRAAIKLSGPELGPRQHVFHATTTDAQGRFEFDGVPPKMTWWLQLGASSQTEARSSSFTLAVPQRHQFRVVKKRSGSLEASILPGS